MRTPTLSTSARLKLGYVALATVDSWLAGHPRKGARRVRYLTKPALMPVLAASQHASTGGHGVLPKTTLAAQAFSWAGDVALLGSGKRSFKAGMGAFGLAHTAYVTGYALNRTSGPLVTPATKSLAVTAAVATPALVAFTHRREPSLAGPLAGYAGSLAAMGITAQLLGGQVSPTARRLISLGAFVFTASDAMLGTRKFVLSNPPAALESAVMATYTAAQLMLSEGAARA